MTPEQIKAAIEAALPGSQVLVRDLTGTGDHYQAVVGSEAFAGKTLIQQHQLVYKALGPAVGNAIHALALKTCSPEEFEQAAAG